MGVDGRAGALREAIEVPTLNEHREFSPMYKHARGPVPTGFGGRLEKSGAEFLAVDPHHRNYWFQSTARELFAILSGRGVASCSEMAACLNGGGFRTATDDLWTERAVRWFVVRNKLKSSLP
jgi:hypothetical protein